MSRVPFTFSLADCETPQRLKERLNDYVSGVNAQLGPIPSISYVQYAFETAPVLTDTQWPAFQLPGSQLVGIKIVKIETPDTPTIDVSHTAAPGLDWSIKTVRGAFLAQPFNGYGWNVDTAYKVTLEVTSNA